MIHRQSMRIAQRTAFDHFGSATRMTKLSARCGQGSLEENNFLITVRILKQKALNHSLTADILPHVLKLTERINLRGERNYDQNQCSMCSDSVLFTCNVSARDGEQ